MFPFVECSFRKRKIRRKPVSHGNLQRVKFISRVTCHSQKKNPEIFQKQTLRVPTNRELNMLGNNEDKNVSTAIFLEMLIFLVIWSRGALLTEMDLSFGGTHSFRGTQNIITLIHYYFNYWSFYDKAEKFDQQNQFISIVTTSALQF